MAGFFASFWRFFAFGGFAGRTAFCECLSCFLPFRRSDLQFFQKMVCNNCSSPDDRRARCEKYRLSRFYRVHLISKEMDRMTNKKFKLAAMSLALTACVAASPLSAGAEAPEAAADVQPSAAADTATEDKPSPETVAAEEPAAEAAADPVEETPAQSTEEPPAQEPEAAPAGDAAVLPALPGARPVVVDMPAAEAPADAAGEPAEAAEDPKDAADSAEETAEDADAAEDAETPEPPEIAIARPDAAQPAVQPGIAAPAIQPGGISVMLPGETRQVALNTQASNEDGTVMGDFETVVKNAKAGQEIILQEDYTGSLTIFDWIRLNLNKKTVTGTITVDLSGKKADGSRGTVEIVNGTITGGTESGVKITGAEGSEILLKDLTITGNRNDTSGYGGGGVCADSGDLTIDHCRITDNTAANGSGGGVSMGGKHGGTVENASLTIKDSVISGNTSTAQGGGVYAAVTDGSVSITGSTLSGNSATAQGGGISVSASGSTDVTLSGNTILENTAGQDGGGIYLSRPEQSETAPDTTICGNTIQKNSGKNGGGIYIRNSMPNRTIAGSVTNTVEQEVLDIGSTVVISGNTAGQLGGGIYADNGVTVRLAGYLLNNHAGTAGADLYLTAGSTEDKNRNVLVLRRVSKDDDWTLVDCGHTIDGWYIDGDEDGNNRWNADATVDADGNEIPKFIMNLDTLLDGSDYTILQDENGDYVITVGGKALALKAAHAVIPPEPTPDPEPTPGPNPTPDPEPTPITPETPESPEVPEAPGETPVTPISTPTQTVAPSGTHLPQTGTSLFAALAMALSGIALTAAGAWASLTGRRCRH
jgi:predicted outer membrane repeat protein